MTQEELKLESIHECLDHAKEELSAEKPIATIVLTVTSRIEAGEEIYSVGVHMAGGTLHLANLLEEGTKMAKRAIIERILEP